MSDIYARLHATRSFCYERLYGVRTLPIYVLLILADAAAGTRNIILIIFRCLEVLWKRRSRFSGITGEDAACMGTCVPCI